jgi:hypothetical protein
MRVRIIAAETEFAVCMKLWDSSGLFGPLPVKQPSLAVSCLEMESHLGKELYHALANYTTRIMRTIRD